jgi:hypothetical protein
MRTFPWPPLPSRCRWSSFGGATLVVAEPEPEDAQPALRTIPDSGEVAGVQSEGGSLAGGERGRQSRLADDRGQHGRLDGHRQREASGETHADRADPGTAALGVRLGRERAQPARDWAGAIGEDAEFAGDTHAQDRPHDRAGGRRFTGSPEQRGQIGGVAGTDQPAAELDDAGMQARDLVDDNDAGSGAGTEHLVGAAVMAEGGGIELWPDPSRRAHRGPCHRPVRS